MLSQYHAPPRRRPTIAPLERKSTPFTYTARQSLRCGWLHLRHHSAITPKMLSQYLRSLGRQNDHYSCPPQSSCFARLEKALISSFSAKSTRLSTREDRAGAAGKHVHFAAISLYSSPQRWPGRLFALLCPTRAGRSNGAGCVPAANTERAARELDRGVAPSRASPR